MSLTPGENNAIAERFFHAAWDDMNFELMDSLLAPHTLDHSTVSGHTEEGAEGFKQIIRTFHAGIPDIKLTIEDSIYAGDRVAHRWVLRGTHTGTLFGIAPTGRNVAFTGTTIVRMEDGKIAERWANVDELGLLRQIGGAPPLPPQPQS
jgi:steroid delta-isomerase-like uncharacterized protein